ncbi:MAG: nucleotidyl transferase AbiEii/AbiGii toxin family protein [Elusimicrobiota bacterium]
MQDLIKHEQFEMEVLERLYNAKILPKLIFVGGTMLRLCYGLDRYSVDLDFWLKDNTDEIEVFNKIKKLINDNYTVKDIFNKHFTMLFEFKKESYPRSLKIEIRKEQKKIKPVKTIAYSHNSNIQIILSAISLEDMMIEKTNAFLDRTEIRDVYDLEFLIKKGIKLNLDKNTAEKIKNKILNLKTNDYKVKLASLLPADKRKYYNKSNFRILLSELNKMIGNF